MEDLFYLMLAYAFFWLLSFILVFSIYNRQKKLDEELASIKQLMDVQSSER
ncbi:MAG TPA: hypothetical protein G4N96_10805 [Chloroflexi bacterium]|nr:hypothetical protein [Chloroflexota bacterium]